jgi:LCP family protein required for cell wall assembly
VLLLLVAWAAAWLRQRPYAPEIDPAGDSPVTPPEFETEVWTKRLEAVETTAKPPVISEPAAISVRHPVRPSIDTLNVLLLGLDRHRGFKRGGSTDTIVVAAFDEASGHLGLIGIPRDLYVSVEGYGDARINAVYGLARLDRRDPLAALERVVEDTLGLPIRHSIAIDLQIFETAVDLVGGIEVEVECAIDDNFVDGRVEGGRRKLSIDAGSQHLDGVTASMFVRSRHGRSDFSRARRQQAVLLGLRRKLASMDGARKLPSLLEGVEGSIETHMSRLELIALARRVLDVAPGQLHGLVLGHAETTAFRTEKNQSVLLPNPEAIETKLNGLFSAPKPGQAPPYATCATRDAALR